MARNDENPYDPPALPTIEDVIEIQGGYPQPQWPEDVILPDNKDRMDYQPPADAAPSQPVPIPPLLPDHIPRPETQPQPEAIETSQTDGLDGQLLAQNSLIDKAQQAADKVEALFNARQESGEVGADAGAALSAVSGDINNSSGLGSQFREAIEALGQDSILEARADEVHDAETVPVEADDTSVGNGFKGVFQALGEISGKLKDAIEAVEHDTVDDAAVIETQADDVYEAETTTVETEDDSDPYNSEP